MYSRLFQNGRVLPDLENLENDLEFERVTLKTSNLLDFWANDLEWPQKIFYPIFFQILPNFKISKSSAFSGLRLKQRLVAEASKTSRFNHASSLWNRGSRFSLISEATFLSSSWLLFALWTYQRGNIPLVLLVTGFFVNTQVFPHHSLPGSFHG